MKFCRYIIVLCLIIAEHAVAMEVQPLESIRDAVRLFVEGNVDHEMGETVVTVGKLDRRLRLSRCEGPLLADFANTSRLLGNITVAVRCEEGPKPWSLMVQARIEQYVEVVVAARPLGRGQELGAEDIKMLRYDISRLNNGYYATLDEVKGMVLKRSVKAGSVLGSSMLKPAILIKRGEKVIIRAQTTSIEVRMEGQALQEGAAGDVIQVKNLSSKQIVEAEVVAPGVVRVRM